MRLLTDSRVDPVFGDVEFTQRIERFLNRYPENPAREEPSGTEAIDLKPSLAPAIPLRDALEGRRSVRSFRPAPIDLRDLANILHFSYGRNAVGHRAVPSAGHFYPLRLTVIARHCTGFPEGVYVYSPLSNRLLKRADRPSDDVFLEAAPGLAAFPNFAAFVGLSARVSDTEEKYGARAARFLLMECGAVLQNAALVAAASNLGLCAFGGGYDVLLERELALDDDIFLGGFVLGYAAD